MRMDNTGETGFAQWAVLELMGHAEVAGYVTEETVFGTTVIRVDVPCVGDIPAYTKFYGPSALYCATPTTEEVVFQYLARYGAKPLNIFDGKPMQPPLLPEFEIDDNEPPF